MGLHAIGTSMRTSGNPVDELVEPVERQVPADSGLAVVAYDRDWNACSSAGGQYLGCSWGRSGTLDRVQLGRFKDVVGPHRCGLTAATLGPSEDLERVRDVVRVLDGEGVNDAPGDLGGRVTGVDVADGPVEIEQDDVDVA